MLSTNTRYNVVDTTAMNTTKMTENIVHARSCNVNVLELTSPDGCRIFTIELITYYIKNFGTELWKNYGKNI